MERKKVLFIDRDGVLLKEAPPGYQVDTVDKLSFYPGMFRWLRRIAAELHYELVMVSNQDGLGTAAFPEKDFWPLQHLLMRSLEGEGIRFSDVHIDRSFPADHAPTRKPGTGMLLQYLDQTQYDIEGSFVIGDRITDMQLAKNLGCKGIWLNNGSGLGAEEVIVDDSIFGDTIVLDTTDWEKVYGFLKGGSRKIDHERNSSETGISIQLDLDGRGTALINTGISFFNHMLEQLAKHGGVDLQLECKGDLHIDEHHTIEDTGIALGEAFAKALGDKRGIERYGFLLPMDDCLAQVAIDFGGRSWIEWAADFKREKIGEMPTEMFFHFFKSFSDGAKCNLNIKAEGSNEHHKIEAIFKAFARAIKMAIKKEPGNNTLPSTKGIL